MLLVCVDLGVLFALLLLVFVVVMFVLFCFDFLWFAFVCFVWFRLPEFVLLVVDCFTLLAGCWFLVLLFPVALLFGLVCFAAFYGWLVLVFGL